MTRSGSKLLKVWPSTCLSVGYYYGLALQFSGSAYHSELISTYTLLRLYRQFKRFQDIFPGSIRTCEEMLGPQIKERAVLPADERPVRNRYLNGIVDTTKCLP